MIIFFMVDIFSNLQNYSLCVMQNQYQRKTEIPFFAKRKGFSLFIF